MYRTLSNLGATTKVSQWRREKQGMTSEDKQTAVELMYNLTEHTEDADNIIHLKQLYKKWVNALQSCTTSTQSQSTLIQFILGSNSKENSKEVQQTLYTILGVEKVKRLFTVKSLNKQINRLIKEKVNTSSEQAYRIHTAHLSECTNTANRIKKPGSVIK